MTDLQIAQRFVRKARQAKERGIFFDLSFTTFKRLLKRKTCYYTGVKFKDKPNDRLELTIDRIDNRLGYVEGNVVACTRRINLAKADLTPEEIKSIYKVLNSLNNG